MPQGPDVADVAATWIDRLHLDPEGRVVEPLLERLVGVDDRTLEEVGAGSLLYAALLLTEGVGLMWGKPWAEYLTIVVTSSLVPLEIYEIARHATAIRVGGLVLNLVIVGYLVVRVRRERASDAARPQTRCPQNRRFSRRGDQVRWYAALM